MISSVFPSVPWQPRSPLIPSVRIQCFRSVSGIIVNPLLLFVSGLAGFSEHFRSVFKVQCTTSKGELIIEDFVNYSILQEFGDG
jgi:hypothetical protein